MHAQVGCQYHANFVVLLADLSTLAVGSECDAHKISINIYYIRVI